MNILDIAIVILIGMNVGYVVRLWQGNREWENENAE